MWLVCTYLGWDNIFCWYSAWDWTKHLIIVACWAGLMTAEELQWSVSGSNSRKNSGNSSSPVVFRTCSDFKRQIQLAITAGQAEADEITFQDQQRITYMPVCSFPHACFSPHPGVALSFTLTVPAPNCLRLPAEQLVQWDPTWSGSWSTIATSCSGSNTTLNTSRIWWAKDFKKGGGRGEDILIQFKSKADLKLG